MTQVNQQVTSTQAKYPGKIQLFRCPVCHQLSSDRWIGSNMLTATERYDDCEADAENVWALYEGKCGSPQCGHAPEYRKVA